MMTPVEYLSFLWPEYEPTRWWQFLNLCDAQRVGFNGQKLQVAVSFTNMYLPKMIMLKVEESNG